MNAHETWSARLSEYLDDELGAEERAACAQHLAACAECRELLAGLERLVARARTLVDRAPERDLWPAIEAALPSKPRTRLWPKLLFFAAGVLLCAAAFLVSRGSDPDDIRVARGERYLLLLHEAPDFGAGLSVAEHAALVADYSAWAESLGTRCEAGEELASDGYELRPGTDARTLPERERVGGFFLLATDSEAEALALARTCPHLQQGGWIEVRPIRVEK